MAVYLLYVIISLIVVLPFLWILINNIDKKIRKKRRTFNGILENSPRKQQRRNILTNSYRYFNKFTITRTYIKRIRIIFEVAYPSDNKLIIEKTMILAYAIWFLSVVEIGAILIFYPSLVGFINASVIVIYTTQELKGYVIDRNNMKLLTQFDTFLSGVRHRYYSDRMIDTAIIESGEDAGYEMSLHSKVIEKILNAHDKEDSINSEEASLRALEEYNESNSNSYMKMFLSLARNVMEFGDNFRNEQSVFLQNISDMRNEVNLEMRNIKENDYMFQALTFVAIVPILALYPIKRWAISNLPELDSFFNGRVGILMAIFLYLLTIACYVLVCHFKLNTFANLKEHKILEKISKNSLVSSLINTHIHRKYTKFEKRQDFLQRIGESITVRQLYVKQLIYCILTFILSNALFIGLHINEKYYIMSNVKEEVATTATSKDNDILSNIVLQYANEYKNKLITQLEVEEMLEQANTFSNSLTRNEVAKEIISKVTKYQSEYYKWYELVFSIIIAYIAFQIPYLLVLYRIKILEMTMETEVIQFQNIIIMLMYIENISIIKILEQMETFAVIFKNSLQKCINNYGDGDLDALENLKEDEKFGPFQNLVDNFIIADKIGVQLAFEEIATDRENSRERRKQEGKFNRDRRSMYATLIAFIPVAAILVFYLIGPFLIYCFEMYKQYKVQMSGML